MKIIAEQLYALRKRKQELIQKMNQHHDYVCNQRESDSVEGIGMPIYTDYTVSDEYARTVQEYIKIQQILSSCDVTDLRDFDQIDIGTAFYAHLNGEKKERFLLIEKDVTNDGSFQFISLDSEFGREVLGKKDGDVVVYKTPDSNIPIQMSIDEIDRVSKHYYHFLRNNSPSKRKNFIVTESQRCLAGEELMRNHSLTPERKSFLNSIILTPTVSPPVDGTIGIGSRVSAFIMDDDGEAKDLEFEIIDKAITMELDSDYVERKSSLGRAVMGLQEKDTFIVTGTNTKGIINTVNNHDAKKERVH